MTVSAPSPISQDKILKDSVNSILWKACDTFRGTVDPFEYKDNILDTLFVKYISKVWQDHFDKFMTRYNRDETRMLLQLDKEKFKLISDLDLFYKKPEA